VHVEVSEQYYEVDAPTLDGVVSILNQTRIGGPNAPRSQGLTEYHVRPEWTASASGGRCHVRSVEVFVDITITLPRWPVVFERPQDEKEGWTRIDGAIRAHEYTHRDLTIEAAADVLERLKGLDAQGCVVLRRVVASTLSVADERLEAAHEELDLSTPLRLPVGRAGG
jgi:predicted secreted Zn-dependent protease